MRDAQDHLVAEALAENRLQHLLLAPVAVEVGGAPTGAHVPQSVLAVEVVNSRLQVDVALARLGVRIGIGVVKGTLDDHVDAPDRIHDRLVSAEIHHRIEVNRHAKVVLDRRSYQGRRAAGILNPTGPCVCGVDLIQSPSGNPGIVVAGD